MIDIPEEKIEMFLILSGWLRKEVKLITIDLDGEREETSEIAWWKVLYDKNDQYLCTKDLTLIEAYEFQTKQRIYRGRIARR